MIEMRWQLRSGDNSHLISVNNSSAQWYMLLTTDFWKVHAMWNEWTQYILTFETQIGNSSYYSSDKVCLNCREDEQPEREQGVPAGSDDRGLHHRGADTLPHQHHQQGPGEKDEKETSVTMTWSPQAREIGYGDKSCFSNDSMVAPGVNCSDIKEEAECGDQEGCYWHYNGLGIEYQVTNRVIWILLPLPTQFSENNVIMYIK